MPMRRLQAVGVLLVFILSVHFAQAKGRKPADSGRASEVETLVLYVLDTPTGDLDVDLLEAFLDLENKEVPKPLRERFLAKKQEITALDKIAQGNKKPPLRRIGAAEKPLCEIEDSSEMKIGLLKSMGYFEIDEFEEAQLMGKTNCTECELQSEFTLLVLAVPAKKKGKPLLKRLLLHRRDPIAVVLELLREGKTNQGTNFFGLGGFPKCR